MRKPWCSMWNSCMFSRSSGFSTFLFQIREKLPLLRLPNSPSRRLTASACTCLMVKSTQLTCSFLVSIMSYANPTVARVKLARSSRWQDQELSVSACQTVTEANRINEQSRDNEIDPSREEQVVNQTKAMNCCEIKNRLHFRRDPAVNIHTSGHRAPGTTTINPSYIQFMIQSTLASIDPPSQLIAI